MFFSVFFQKFCCFLYSFRGISVLSLKNFFLSLERFIIALCQPFFIILPWFALRYFCFTAACLLKVSIKTLRKCWYFILFISCFNIPLSSLALNGFITEFPIVPAVYYFWFQLRKTLFQNCSCKFVKIRESCFKDTTILKTSRVFGQRKVHDAFSGFLK